MPEFKSKRKLKHRAPLRLVFQMGRCFREIFFPRLCPICLERLQQSEIGLCAYCAWQLAPYRPLRWRAEERLWGSNIFRQLYSLYVYEKGTPIQDTIHAYKYHSNRELGAMFAQRALLLFPLATRGYDLIIVVPTTYIHRLERGYNPAMILANHMAKALGIPASDTHILRHRASQTQTHLNREERRSNVRRAYYLNTSKQAELKDKTVLLVDDVLTTGATLLAMLDLLEEAGVVKADVLTATVAV